MILTKFFSDDHQMPFLGGLNMRITNPTADSRHLENIEKSPYLNNGLTDRHEIWQVDAVRPLKNFKF